jgi:hypothetical protein
MGMSPERKSRYSLSAVSQSRVPDPRTNATGYWPKYVCMTWD